MDSDRDLGFMFHWGVYAIPAFNPPRKKKGATYNGSEWYLMRCKNTFLYGKSTMEYHTKEYGDTTKDEVIHRYYDEWLPLFETLATKGADRWCALVKKFGGKYAILTVKHHDGISLYPTAYSSFHTSHDFIADFVAACRKYDLQVGLYYSLLEWSNNPVAAYSTGKKKITPYVNLVMQPQLREICTRYEPDILWVDGDWQHTAEVWRSYEFLDWLHRSYPKTVTNDRWGKDFDSERTAVTIYKTGKDRYIPGSDVAAAGKWEHVNTISSSWGYAANQTASDYKTVKELKSLETEVLSEGGRFTLNFGPKADGSLDPKELLIATELFK